MKKWVVWCAAGMFSFHTWAFETAGTLLVNLEAADLKVSVGEGNKVQSWQNKGAQFGAFTNVVAGQGPVFCYGPAGAPAVYFSGESLGAKNNNSILAGMMPDARITGANSWTMEAWINVPVLPTYNATFFAWTYRGASPDGRLFEARYSGDGNAIEHYGGNYNVGWNVKPPAGQWHHVVLTRDGSTNIEYVYVNGLQVNSITRTGINLMNDGIFTIGGVQNGARNGWDMQMSGYIGQIRVHTGFMPLGDATTNYVLEREAYGTENKISLWNGAVGTAFPWETSGNWVASASPDSTARVVIDNGGSANLSTAGSARMLYVTHGELNMTGSAALDLWVSAPGARLYVANMPNTTGTLNVTEGLLGLRDNNATAHLSLGSAAGAVGTMTVGGGLLPARVEVGRDILMADAANATGRLTVLTNGTLTAWGGNGYIYVGNNINNADGKLTVNGGTVIYPRITLGRNGGRGVLEINDGYVRLSDMLHFAPDTASVNGRAILQLNGGVLQAQRLNVDKKDGENAVYFNGGTLRNTQTPNDFIQDIPLYVQAGGAIFDIIGNMNDVSLVTDVTMPRALQHDPALAGPDGGLVKRGPGVLRLSGLNTFTGDITVEDGLLVLTRTDGLPSGYPGKIRFTSPDAIVGCTQTDSIDWMLSLIANDADGYLAVFPENATENIDLSNHPDLKLAFRGNVNYQGTITPAAGAPLCLSPMHQATLTYSKAITGGTSLLVDGQGNGTLVLGNANNYTGGTTVKGGKIRLDSLAQLGGGDITLENEGALLLNDPALDPAILLPRITVGSHGFLLLTNNNNVASLNFDLSGHPGLYIGAPDSMLTYTGTITPDGADYHVGGGWLRFRAQNNATGLSLANLTDNGLTPRGVAIEGNGIVRIPNAGNTFTGPIAVTNKGALYINASAQELAGSSSLTVSDGVLRLADSVTVPSSVTLTAGDGGVEVNPWGGTYMAFAGALNGSGRIWTSDAGGLFFGDVSGFTGLLDPCHTTSGSTLGVIVGAGFVGWNPAITVSNSSLTSVGYFGVRSDIDHTWSTTLGNPLGSDSPYNLGLKKRGTGMLTVDVAQLYTGGDTLVEQGTLIVAHDKALPAGIGRGRVSVSDGAVLDVNEHDVAVNALIDVGTVTNSTGTAQTLTVGVDDSASTFTAWIADGLTLVKAGNGTLTLAPFKANDVQIKAGTVTMRMSAAIDGDFSLTGSSTLQVEGSVADMGGETQGLAAYYFQMGNSDRLNATLVASIDTVLNFFNTAVPNSLLATNTTHAGATLDFDRTTSTANNRFPPPFNVNGTDNFCAIYRGTFIAEQTGTYTFGLDSDDRSALFINGAKIVERSGWGAYEQGTISLDEGEHDILICYTENGGSQGLKVGVRTPDDAAISPMPQSLLRPESAPPACRVGGVDGSAATTLRINGSAIASIGPAEQNATATFSGTVNNSDRSTLRKVGAGRQILSGTAMNLGYVDAQEGTLELAMPNGNAPAFVSSYLVAFNIGAFTGVTMASLTGEPTGGTVALADNTLLMMNKPTTTVDTTFGNSLEGSAQTAIVKNDGRTLTLTGNNDDFLGTWVIHSGAVIVAAGGTIGQGNVINNGELWFTGDEDYFVNLSTGNGRVVKQGAETLYVRGANIGQTFIVEGGSVVFDTQGGTMYLSKIPETVNGGTWSVTGGGRVLMTGSGEPAGSHIVIDGTEWIIPAGSVPVQKGLAIALDASKRSSLEVDANGLVTRWASVASEAIAYTNANLAGCPRYEPNALGGLGAVLFGTNVANQVNTATRLSTTTPAVMQTVFMVSRFTQTQGGRWPNVFGQTGTDAGIRAQENTTSWKSPGSTDDFVNGTGGLFYLNGAQRTDANPDVGTSINLMTQYAGSSKSGWTTPINTSVGWYHEDSRFSMIEMGELLVYSSKLSDNDRLTVEAYLTSKWLSGQLPVYNLPQGLIVELRTNGVMNLEGSSQTVATVIGGAGGGSVMNGTLTISGTLVINVKPDGTTDAPAFDNVAFRPNAKLIVNGLENAKGVIELFTANSATPVPPFDKASLPKGWSVTYSNGVCRLSRGSTVMILK